MVGSMEPSWGSESRLTSSKRVISPSARKYYYKDWDEELESGGSSAGELEERS